MRELEGRSYAEISDTIGVSVSAVETLIFRARKSLRLKASALRSLAAIPLPSSLGQFFDTGTVVAGGGAVAGGGFLAKALIAVVAGAFATGVGGDRSGPAAAASNPRGLATGWSIGSEQMARGLASPAISGAHFGPRGAERKSAAGKVRGTGRANGSLIAGPSSVSTHGTAGSGTSASTAAAPSGSAAPVPAPVTQVSQSASTVLGTVQQTVQAPAVPTVPAVSLPVSPPTLPPLPPPPLPGGTPLP
jgi:hypothetical protein